MVSAKDNCKRALVTLLKTLGALYGCCVGVTRESTETEVRKAYRAVSKGVHPDRGGNTEDQKRLDLTYGAWNNAGTAKTKAETKKGKEGKDCREGKEGKEGRRGRNERKGRKERKEGKGRRDGKEGKKKKQRKEGME